MQTTPPPIPSNCSTSPLPTAIPKPQTSRLLRTAATVVAAAVGLLVAGLGCSIALRHVSHQVEMRSNHDKVELIRKIQALRLPRDSSEARTLCTQNGFVVWTAMQKQFPEASAGFTTAGFKNSGDVSDVAMIRDTIEGVSKVHVRLIRTGAEWRFQDLYCSELQGRRMDLWASDAVEHPLLAAAKFHKPEIEAAAKEVIGAIKGTADFARDLSFIIKTLKGN